MKIKKNDQVLIISGKDRGKKGQVQKVFPLAQKITIENINLVKKHRRPRRQGEKGQVVEIAKPLAVSNVKLVCSKCGQVTRVGYKITETGKFRVCKKCEQEI